ncbi:MAG: hypothetical protein JO086_18005 [Acidimicrobiia bacterium]|nr:hypothetical protein [Acidimicrobiia bacterium]
MVPADAHWAAVSGATQRDAAWRAECLRRRREERAARMRVRFGLMLVRAGLRLASPLTPTNVGAAQRS